MLENCNGSVDVGFAALSYGQAAFLGVIQGITELLPISSTAHMRVVPALLGWVDPGSAFSAAMQLAALFAVVTYFAHDIFGLIGPTLKAIRQRDYKDPSFRFSLGLVLGTIPIVIAGAALSHLLNQCNTPLRSLTVIGVSSLGMALLLALAEVLAKHKRKVGDVRLRDAIIVGIAQVGALIPGVSRSGSTLTAALFLGFEREEAARFSFLLGVPAILLAGLKEIWVLAHLQLSLHAWTVLGVGLLSGSISAFFAIWGLLRFLERMNTWPFVVYRAALGILLLVM
jgi:undecaprenyl-diphosphatase